MVQGSHSGDFAWPRKSLFVVRWLEKHTNALGWGGEGGEGGGGLEGIGGNGSGKLGAFILYQET